MAAFDARRDGPDPRGLVGELVEIDGATYRVIEAQTESGVSSHEHYPAHLSFDLLVSRRV